MYILCYIYIYYYRHTNYRFVQLKQKQSIFFRSIIYLVKPYTKHNNETSRSHLCCQLKLISDVLCQYFIYYNLQIDYILGQRHPSPPNTPPLPIFLLLPYTPPSQLLPSFLLRFLFTPHAQTNTSVTRVHVRQTNTMSRVTQSPDQFPCFLVNQSCLSSISTFMKCSRPRVRGVPSQISRFDFSKY